MLRPILKYGDTLLQNTAEPVTEITAEVDALARDMIETMYAAPGIGLAAPQVGVMLRLFVIDLSLGRDPKGLIALINPELTGRDGMQLEGEGLLARAFQHEMDHLEGRVFLDRLRGIKRDLIVSRIRKQIRNGRW